jgi:hypothetical protein
VSEDKCVAELIGWEHRSDINYANGERVWWWQPSGGPNAFDRDPTADDLVAWLINQEGFAYDNEFHGPLAILSGRAGFVVVLTDQDGDEFYTFGVTILAALESAVREVWETRITA